MAAGELGPGGDCSEWGAEDRSGCRPLPAWGCPRTKPYPSISLESETGARSSCGEVVMVMMLVGLVFSTLLPPLPDSSTSPSSLESHV